MTNWKKPHTYSYYDYIHKYSGRFLNRYQSQTYWITGRGTQFLNLLMLKAWRLKGNRNWHWVDYRFGPKFSLFLYIPIFFYITASYALTPAWRRLDERYHLRYGPGDDDDIEDLERHVTYQQRKKPYTRRKYADAIKIVYEGKEDFDYASEQPIRYR